MGQFENLKIWEWGNYFKEISVAGLGRKITILSDFRLLFINKKSNHLFVVAFVELLQLYWKYSRMRSKKPLSRALGCGLKLSDC